jgi:hypothetical protein
MRESQEIVVVHGNLDAARVLFDFAALDCNEERGEQRNEKQKRGKARSRVDTIHEPSTSPKKQEGPLLRAFAVVAYAVARIPGVGDAFTFTGRRAHK